MTPWLWLLPAAQLGAIIGFILAALCAAAKAGDRDTEVQQMMTPEKTAKFIEFGNALDHLMDRWKRLPAEDQTGVLESIIRAYLSEAEQCLGGDFDRACARTLRMADALLKRKEV